MTKRLTFIERKNWHESIPAFSLEKVFAQIAAILPADRYETKTVKLRFGNSAFDIFKNLGLFSRPESDIFHITGQIHYMALRLPPEQTVLTVHDLVFLQRNNTSKYRQYATRKLFLDLPIQRLKFVTAVSNATKKEIIDSTGCDPDKVRVIYNPLQETLSNGEPKAFNKDFPTILQIGITENKNISRLIDALEGIPCKLVLVGHLPGSLQAKLRSSGVNYQIVHDLNDEQMRKAYEDADIVSFCSTYEGFGLPIIEAQGMCRPLLTSDLPPMNEVAGQGAWFVDPFDVSSIRSGLMAIINNDSLRSEIVEKGIENVRRFDPSLIAGQYLELYDEITY